MKNAVIFMNHPFSNCQLFTLGSAYQMINCNESEIKSLFKYIGTKLTGKKQVLIDIKQSKLEDMKKTLKPIYKKFKIKKYISTNSSEMVLCLVVLDKDKYMK